MEMVAGELGPNLKEIRFRNSTPSFRQGFAAMKIEKADELESFFTNHENLGIEKILMQSIEQV
ncbi:hypothetical protein Pint_15378 [Pistacia integerrima]|nr:hypothetical protein Pint_15378 [Pistacia integerrima]